MIENKKISAKPFWIKNKNDEPMLSKEENSNLD
jgi:hypothetical protein